MPSQAKRENDRDSALAHSARALDYGSRGSWFKSGMHPAREGNGSEAQTLNADKLGCSNAQIPHAHKLVKNPPLARFAARVARRASLTARSLGGGCMKEARSDHHPATPSA